MMLRDWVSNLQKTLWALLGVLALLGGGNSWAAGACATASIGKVTLNEYNYIDNYTEINKIDTTVDMTGWTVTVFTSGKTTSKSLPSAGTSTCFGGKYQTSNFASNEIGTNADVVLRDSAGDIVDFLRVRTSLPVSTTFYGPKPACTFLGTTTDLAVSSGNKGADRLPDGTGDWRQTPGTGSNSFQSPCGPNITGGIADLSITKTVITGTVVKGTAVSFTLTVTNAGPGVATAVLVNDTLPTGLSFSSASTATGSYSSSTGVWTIGNMAVGQSATLTLNATTTLVGTLTNTATVTSSTFDPITSNNTASASVIVSSPGATLDTVEVAAAAGTAIYTKVAGQAFSLDILSLATDGTLATSYTKTVALELVDSSSSATCSAMTALQAAGSYTFTGSGVGKDNGRHTFAFNYPNAARNVRVRMKDNSAIPITSCSTDNFAIRPSSITLSLQDLDARNAGTTRTLNNGTASGGVVHNAGRPFTVTATAYSGAGTPAVTAAYDGTPTAQLSACSAAACTSSFGTFALSVSSFTTGVLSSALATYSDVGSFNLQLQDTSFTAVDAADTVGNCTSTGRYVCSASTLVGRFIPDRFDTALTQGCTAGSFTYSGQPFAVSVSAKNFSGGTTSLYTSGVLANAVTLSNAGVTSNLTGNVLAATSFVAGVASATPTYMFSSPTTVPLAFTARAAETAADAVTSSGATEGTTTIRSGRVRLVNGYGSELLPLALPVDIQYYSSSGWTTNSADTCTQLVASNFAFTAAAPSCSTAVSSCITALSVTATGTGPYRAPWTVGLSKPTSAGYACITLNLDGAAAGNRCTATGTPGSPVGSVGAPWLRHPWSSAASTNPAALVTFGIYKSPLIYRRENY